MTTRVEVEADGAVIPCTNGNACDLRYYFTYTPTLYDTIPSQVYQDQRVSFMLNPMETKYALNDDMEPVQSIRIGGANVDWEGIIDASTETTHSTVDAYSAYIGDQKTSKDSSVDIKFRTGNVYKRATSKHCLFDMSECWTVRTHPTISSIDKSQGFTSGGQTLQISGTGLKGTDVQVSVAGVDCTVTEITNELITCQTGEAAAASVTGVTQPYTAGLRSKTMDPTNSDSGVGKSALVAETHPVTDESILTSFEVIHDTLYKAGRKITGYFKAPATGNFRFKLACDD